MRQVGSVLSGGNVRQVAVVRCHLAIGNRWRQSSVQSFSTLLNKDTVDYKKLMGESLQLPAGRLWKDDEDHDHYIPEVKLHERDGRQRRRVLVLCTGGTLTMAPSPEYGGALAPVEGALSECMEHMDELPYRTENKTTCLTMSCTSIRLSTIQVISVQQTGREWPMI